MAFQDREDAGKLLAGQMAHFAASRDGSGDTVVLGIPRGGVVVAFEIAEVLHAPLDVFLSRKLGVPGQEELAFGAIASNSERFLDERIVRASGISAAQIESISQEAPRTLETRSALYRAGTPEVPLEGRAAILVDDGIATGASIYAAILALRKARPRELIVAVPVAPGSVCRWLEPFTDGLICLQNPRDFYAVGQFYRDFEQVPDETVMDLLRQAAKR
jgi:putative phosphoribosyl transferase